MQLFEMRIPRGPAHDSTHSVGHMGELAVRLTRKGTDAVWENHVPCLARKLTQGKLTLQDIIETRNEYFGKQPAVASMFQSDVSFGDGQAIYPGSTFTSDQGSLVAQVGGASARTIDVVAGDTFNHPRWQDVRKLGEKLVDQMNTFVKKAPTLPDTTIDLLTHKFYLLYSTIHVPADGSGRMNGDTNTLLQKGIALSLAAQGRDFQPHYISHNGYRINGAENWAMDEQTRFRSYLVGDVMRFMNKRNPLLWILGLPNNAQGTQHIQRAEKALERYKTAYFDDELVTRSYDRALTRALDEQIDRIFDMSGASWINALSKAAIRRRQKAHTSSKYYRTKDLNYDFVPILDTAVSLSHFSQDQQLADLLGSRHLVSPALMRSNVRRGIIQEIHQELCKSDRALAATAARENGNLAPKEY